MCTNNYSHLRLAIIPRGRSIYQRLGYGWMLLLHKLPTLAHLLETFWKQKKTFTWSQFQQHLRISWKLSENRRKL